MSEEMRYPLHSPVVEFMLELVDISCGPVPPRADDGDSAANPAYGEVASHLAALTKTLYPDAPPA